MKKTRLKAIICAMALMITACGGASSSGNSPATQQAQTTGQTSQTPQETTTPPVVETPEEESKVLIAYFTRLDNTDASIDEIVQGGGPYGSLGNSLEEAGVDGLSTASITLVDGNVQGNTETLAKMIQENVGGDLFSIETDINYPVNYDDLIDQGREEQEQGLRPTLTTQVENMENYDTVFLGFPNWWYNMPVAVYSFLEAYDFSGKTIIPFTATAGSGFSNNISVIQELASDATVVTDGLNIPMREVAGAGESVKTWIDGLGISFDVPTASQPVVASSVNVPENFVLIQGGTFQMGSPDTEAWRSADEAQHNVTVDDFYMDIYEVTQDEYEQIMGDNPSTFRGQELPVEGVSWLNAVEYCNRRSEAEGLAPAYTIDGENVSWDRSADGYRLPTEAEWEYACRANTVTPFNTETSISVEEANYWGHYPYMIEDNYFEQQNLETKPGIYRETTVSEVSFAPNNWGLYNMHGNVGEWVWDYYAEYDVSDQTNPSGPASGTLRINRGGGWNDFAKNLRSAYRATMPPENQSAAVGFRLVRNAGTQVEGTVTTIRESGGQGSGGNMLIAYFSWGGNTRGIAQEIQNQTGADIFEINPVTPYSSSYNTVLEEAQRDQNIQARPELDAHVANMDDYDIIILGYPNWWASIPMPVASFLEEYDLAGKTILPFCSHGGGRFGQSLTAISKLAPQSTLGEGLAISYSGGSGMASDVTAWLETNGIN